MLMLCIHSSSLIYDSRILQAFPCMNTCVVSRKVVRLWLWSVCISYKNKVDAKLPLKILIPGRWQLKTPILSRNVDQKSLETEFSIGICLHTGDKWQSKTLFLLIFDPHLSIVNSVFDCRLPGVILFKKLFHSHWKIFWLWCTLNNDVLWTYNFEIIIYS